MRNKKFPTNYFQGEWVLCVSGDKFGKGSWGQAGLVSVVGSWTVKIMSIATCACSVIKRACVLGWRD